MCACCNISTLTIQILIHYHLFFQEFYEIRLLISIRKSTFPFSVWWFWGISIHFGIRITCISWKSWRWGWGCWFTKHCTPLHILHQIRCTDSDCYTCSTFSMRNCICWIAPLFPILQNLDKYWLFKADFNLNTLSFIFFSVMK